MQEEEKEKRKEEIEARAKELAEVYKKEILEEFQKTSEWTEVSSRKKKRNSPEEKTRNVKQRLITDYREPIINPKNRFQYLESAPDENDKVTNAKKTAEELNNAKTPPIFISGVGDIQEFTNILDNNNDLINKYTMKIMNNSDIKLMTNDVLAYRAAISKLTQVDVKFHTYQLKQDRSFRVVIKNLHATANLQNLTKELNDLDHKVRNIVNVKSRRTKMPLAMFFVDLEPQDNNKTVYDIEFLQRCKITIEPIRQQRSIPQCANCLRLGHTKRYCTHNQRCVKCGGFHSNKQCTISERAQLKCALCSGNHPANYKGCEVYKKLQQNKFPALRSKTMPNAPNAIPRSASKDVSKNQSYASVVQGATNTTHLSDPNNDIQSNERLDKLEKLIEKMGERMDTMMSIITQLLSKLK